MTDALDTRLKLMVSTFQDVFGSETALTVKTVRAEGVIQSYKATYLLPDDHHCINLDITGSSQTAHVKLTSDPVVGDSVVLFEGFLRTQALHNWLRGVQGWYEKEVGPLTRTNTDVDQALAPTGPRTDAGDALENWAAELAKKRKQRNRFFTPNPPKPFTLTPPLDPDQIRALANRVFKEGLWALPDVPGGVCLQLYLEDGWRMELTFKISAGEAFTSNPPVTSSVVALLTISEDIRERATLNPNLISDFQGWLFKIKALYDDRPLGEDYNDMYF